MIINAYSFFFFFKSCQRDHFLWYVRSCACACVLCQAPNVATHDDCGALEKHSLNQQRDKTHLNPAEFLCQGPVNGPVLKVQTAHKHTVRRTVATIVSAFHLPRFVASVFTSEKRY